MKSHTIFCLLVITLTPVCPSGWCETQPQDPRTIAHKSTPAIDFTDFIHGSVEEWLQGKGFVLQKDARLPGKIKLSADEGRLVFHANTKVFGLIMNKGLDIRRYRSIRIDWRPAISPGCIMGVSTQKRGHFGNGLLRP